jgi:hypothetical protein
MDSLFDQSKRSRSPSGSSGRARGWRSADAVAMRSVSQSVDVRDSAVEESAALQGAAIWAFAC